MPGLVELVIIKLSVKNKLFQINVINAGYLHIYIYISTFSCQCCFNLLFFFFSPSHLRLFDVMCSVFAQN